MNTFKLNHLHIVCSDLQNMVRFWTEGVGADLICYRTFGNADGAVLNLDGLRISLRLPKENEQVRERRQNSFGYDHLGLEVNDLDDACNHLADFACKIDSGPFKREGRKTVFLKGPDNVVLELMQIDF